MTRTRKSLLLTVLLVVGALTAGLTGAVSSSTDATSSIATTYQAQDDDVADATVDSGEVYWQGQFLQFDAGEANASEVWAVRRVQNGQVGGLVTEVLLGSSGSAVVSTTNLDGQYVVVNENEQPVAFSNGQAQRVGNVSTAAFEVAEQTLNASFAAETVQNANGSDARTDLRVRSNRAGFQAYLFSEQLSPSQLAQIFSEVEVRDDRAVITRNVSDDAVFDADFSGVEPGTYNVSVVSADGTARDTASITVSEPVEGSAGLSNGTFTEQRGDVVRFNVTFDGTDRATVTVGSQEVGYRSRFTVVDANGDGVATVAVDTYRAGTSPGTPGISVVGEDRLTDFELLTDPIPNRLDAATYPITVSVGGSETAVGVIDLQDRSTGGIQVWTVPDSASPDSVSQLTEVATQDADIAYQDWAVVQVQASGLYSYVQNVSDLNNNSTGLSMTLTRVGEINVPSQEVSLDQARLLVDEEGNQFFLLVDSNSLEADATYRANFTISSANAYVSNATTLATNFTVVNRTASFDEPVEVPSSTGATISGNSSVAPGTELTVEATNTGSNPFIKRQTATVSEGGTWQATFDFSDVPPDTNFSVSIDDPQANATGVVVSGGGGAGAAQTTTEAGAAQTTQAGGAQTTAAGQTQTEGEAATQTATGDADAQTTATGDAGQTTAAETTAAGDAQAEQTTEAGTTTTTTTTVADAESAPAPGFGPVVALVAGALLLAGGALVTRR